MADAAKNNEENVESQTGAASSASASSNPLIRLGVLGVILASVGVVLIYMVQKLNEPNMELLFGDLDLADSNKIVQKVEAMGIPTEVRSGGTQVLVPSDQVARVRMAMAEAGLPVGGSVGYEIFDKTESLGTTSFVQNINKKRALEGELSRTISSLSQVLSARVHLVLPKKELFSKSQEEPRASIMLTINGSRKLSLGQIDAIKHLVSAAVPNLMTSNISIIDNRGNLLASGNGEERENAPLDLDDSRFAYEAKMARSLESMIEKVVGVGKVRVEVNANMDFDRITENAEIFDSAGGVPRSTQVIEEEGSSRENSESSGSSVSAKIPGGAGGGTSKVSGNSNKTRRTEETTNYEISKTIRTHVKESGGIKRISVAVLVDGIYKTDKDGAAQYTPRPKEELDKIEKLVKSAIGFDAARNDSVQIINMPFVPVEMIEGTEDDGKIMGLERGQVVKIAEIFIVSFFGLLIMLLVVKPVISRILEATFPPTAPSGAGGSNVIMGPQSIAAPQTIQMQQAAQPSTIVLSAAQQQSPNVVVQQPAEQKVNNIEKIMQMKQIEGEVMSSSMETIAKVVEENEAATVTQVKNWIYEK